MDKQEERISAKWGKELKKKIDGIGEIKQKAKNYLKNGNLKEFEKLIFKSSKIIGTVEIINDFLYDYVTLILRNRKYKQGICFLKKFQEEFKGYTIMDLFIRDLYFYSGELDIALEITRKLKKEVLSEELEFLNRQNEAVILQKQGKYKEAINIYEHLSKYALILEKNNLPQINLNKALCFFSLKDYGKAINSFNQVLDIEKKNFSALLHKGLALIEIGEEKIGKKYVDEAFYVGSERVPDLLRLFQFYFSPLSRGYLYNNQTQVKEAEKKASDLIEKIFKIEPENIKALEYKLLMEISKKGLPKSLNLAKKILGINPKSEIVFDSFIEYYRKRDTKKYLYYLKKAISDGSKSDYHWNLYSLYYIKKKNYKKAFEILKKGEKIGISSPRAQLVLCLYKLGKYKDVIQVFSKKEFDMKFGEGIEDTGEVEVYTKSLIKLNKKQKAINFIKDQIEANTEIIHSEGGESKEMRDNHKQIVGELMGMLNKYEK